MTLKRSALLLTVAMAGIGSASLASAQVPQGVWLIDGEAAVQIFDCDRLLCGRILWLQNPHDAAGELKRDKKNPDPSLRQRQLCGLTLLWGLHPTGSNQWGDGSFYYPDSGKTYDIKVELKASDALVARFYDTISIVGETKTLSRVQPGTLNGTCSTAS